MSDYSRSTSGRLLGLAFSLMFGAGALSVLAGTSYVFSPPATLMIFLALVAGVGCATLGVEEHPVQTLLVLILMPIGGLFYVALVGAVLPHYAASGYALAALSAVNLAVALRPGRGEPDEAHALLPHAAGH